MASSTKAHADAHMADGDQHDHLTKQDEHTGPKLDEGKLGSHKGNDPQDARSLSNRANAEKLQEKREQEESDAEKYRQAHPTSLAESHGNKPSKGAKIDEQIQREEEEELKRKGKA